MKVLVRIPKAKENGLHLYISAVQNCLSEPQTYTIIVIWK